MTHFQLGFFINFLVVVSVGVVGKEWGVRGPPHDQVYGDYEYMPKHGFPHEKLELFNHGISCAAKSHPFLHTSIPDIIKKSGYEFEEHTVTSEKGYKVTLYRIPGSPVSPIRMGKIPVILNHGSMGNALSFLFLEGNNSLGFKLANAGYDVWLMNHRGSAASIDHESLNTTSDAFWDFSFHEKAVEDIPAIIEEVLKQSKHKSLYYVGHSQGTIQMSILLCEKPHYADKIRVNFYLGPAMYIHHASAVGLNLLLAIGPDHAHWKTLIGNKISEHSIQKFLGTSCAAEALGCDLCENFVEYMNGINTKKVEPSLGYFFARRYYDSASTKSLAHLAQFKIYDRFAKWSYPTEAENMKVYGSKQPPEYDFKNMRAPTVVFWGYSDEMTVKEDVKKSMLAMPKEVLVEINRVHLRSFTHLDHLYAAAVPRLVYDRIQWIMDTGKYVKQNISKHRGKYDFLDE